MKRLARFLLASTLLAGSVLSVPAHAADWAKSRKLTVDTTAQGAGIEAPVAQLPLLVRLHSGNFDFKEAKPDGSDLRFFEADGKTPLKHHVERWDAGNELAMVWVQMPTVAPGTRSDALLLRWGNPDAPSADDRKGVYDASHVLVLNFSDASGVQDASAAGNAVRVEGARLIPNGPIAGAAQFDGSGRLVVAAAPSLRLGAADGWTFMAWVNPAAGGGTLLGFGDGGGIELGADDRLAVRQGKVSAVATAPLRHGSWQHVAVSYAGGKLAFFVDGAPAGEALATLADAQGEAVIGAGLRGSLDAVSLARGSRSAAYVKAAAKSQGVDSGMVTFADDDGGSAGASYFSILIGAVTVDGWVVIGLLGVMAAVSLYVMVTKALYLRRTERANAAFLQVFREDAERMLHPADALVGDLRSNPALRDSSIYQLYGLGIEELGKRLPARAGLSATSLEAIRATLDAAIVRAGQRFNSGIVLLTIAISGGPFLGLLGTVVGVMITFAAIAAAGDVNVNSIAPGIAAALVATVAGLAVAIPALFAYNWFAIRIKNISADTQVFADEFLTRSAEIYTR